MVSKQIALNCAAAPTTRSRYFLAEFTSTKMCQRFLMLLFFNLAFWLTVTSTFAETQRQTSARTSSKLPVGFVIISRGETSRTEPNTRKTFPLKRRSQLFSGDEVKTGPKSGLQIKFTDGSIIALKANTRLQIAHYNYAPNGNSSRSFFALLEGGIRAISGAIGQKNPDQYRLKTPVATIGIRGTHYAVALDREMYVGVWEGGISVSNKGGSLNLGADANYRFASISAANQKPEGLQQAPSILTELMGSTQADPDDTQSNNEQTTIDDNTTAGSTIEDGPQTTNNIVTNNTTENTADIIEFATTSHLDQRTDVLQSNTTRDSDEDGAINIENSGNASFTTPVDENGEPISLQQSSLFSLSTKRNEDQNQAFGSNGVLAGDGETGNDPAISLFNQSASPNDSPTWFVTRNDPQISTLSLPGQQLELIPIGVSLGRWESTRARDTLLNPSLDLTITDPAYWMTADLRPDLPTISSSYRLSTPLFFSGDTHAGTDTLRSAYLDLTIDFNNPSAVSGDLTLVSVASATPYDTEVWSVGLSGSYSDRQLQLSTTATSTLVRDNTSTTVAGDLQGFLVQDGASLASAIKLFAADDQDLWFNGIFGATGFENRLSEADLSNYVDGPALALAASVSNNNYNLESPLFRHDQGVFAGPALLSNNTLSRFADLWRLGDLSTTDIFGVEYLVAPGGTVSLLTNVTPIDLLNDGVVLPQMEGILHLPGAWSAPSFLYDPLDSTQTVDAIGQERLIWLTSRPATASQLDSTRTGLFDTVAYAYFEDASAVLGQTFTFSMDGSGLADFATGTLSDFELTIETDTHRYTLNIPSSLFNQNGSNVPAVDFTDAGVRGTVCTLSDCENTERPTHGELKLAFLDKGQTLGGSIKLWDDADLEQWIAGVFTLAEDTRLVNGEATAINEGKYALTVQSDTTARLTNQIDSSDAFILKGKAATDTQGAPTLLKDTRLSQEGLILRHNNPNNLDVGSLNLGGETIGWGRWDANDTGTPTVQTDFGNNPGNYDVDIYWISGAMTPVANLPTGTAIYDGTIQMLGQLNGFPIDTNPAQGSSSFTIDFNAMSFDGSLGISNGGNSQDATLNIIGTMSGAELKPTRIDVLSDTTPVASAASEFNAAVVGGNAEGIAGGWHVQDPGSLGGGALENTSGVFVIQRQ